MTDVVDALTRWLAQHSSNGDANSLPQVKQANPTSTPTPSDVPGQEDELLTLAPEADDNPGRKQKSLNVADAQANVSAVELDTLPDESMLAGNDTSVESNNNLTELLDELLDEDALESDPIASHSPADLSSLGNNVPGSDVLRTPLASHATHASPSDEPSTAQRTKQFFSELLEGMKRGDYPVWILIGAGLILGAILLFVAFSYVSSFEPIEVPDRMGEG